MDVFCITYTHTKGCTHGGGNSGKVISIECLVRSTKISLSAIILTLMVDPRNLL